jgi:predicted CopG family antitoxin
MQRKLTITVADEVYRGLHRTVGRGAISRFIEDLVRSHVVADGELDAEYRAIAAEVELEREAREWLEFASDEGVVRRGAS